MQYASKGMTVKRFTELSGKKQENSVNSVLKNLPPEAPKPTTTINAQNREITFIPPDLAIYLITRMHLDQDHANKIREELQPIPEPESSAKIHTADGTIVDSVPIPAISDPTSMDEAMEMIRAVNNMTMANGINKALQYIVDESKKKDKELEQLKREKEELDRQFRENTTAYIKKDTELTEAQRSISELRQELTNSQKEVLEAQLETKQEKEVAQHNKDSYDQSLKQKQQEYDAKLQESEVQHQNSLVKTQEEYNQKLQQAQMEYDRNLQQTEDKYKNMSAGKRFLFLLTGNPD